MLELDLIVYASGEGPFLIIPDCFLPPLAAQATYGPLSVCGRISHSEGGAKLWCKFGGEIEEHSFAVVSVAEMTFILGRDHPLLERFRKCAPRRKAIQVASSLQSPAETFVVWPHRPQDRAKNL